MTKKLKFNTYILILGAFYFAGSIIQNILAVKTFGTSSVSFCDAGTLISWLVFACMDIITEIYDKKTAIKYFVISSALNVFFTTIFMIADAIPGNDATMSEVFSIMLSTNWRIVLASVSAFLVGNYVNAVIMNVMKVRAKDKSNKISFIFRAIISTIFGQLIDNALFYLIAFSPINIPNTYEMPWINILQNVSFTTAIEVISESFMSPITALVVSKLIQRREEDDKIN